MYAHVYTLFIFNFLCFDFKLILVYVGDSKQQITLSNNLNVLYFVLLLNLTLHAIYCHIFPLHLKDSLVAKRHTITRSRPKPRGVISWTINVLFADTTTTTSTNNSKLQLSCHPVAVVILHVYKL